MRTAIIPVGGTGRRMLPLTATIPKPLLPVNMKAAVHYIVNECVDSGVERIGLVTKYRAQDIIDYFTENIFPEFDDVDIDFIPQGDGWGMMDAICSAEDYIGGDDFSVLLADDIIRSGGGGGEEMEEVDRDGFVLGCERVPRSKVHRYGAVVPLEVRGRSFTVKKVVEKPEQDIGTDIVISGRYQLKNSIFDIVETMGCSRPLSLTDVIAESVNRGVTVSGCIFNGRRYDIGDPEGYSSALVDSITEGWEH